MTLVPPQDNKTVVRRYLQQAWGRGNLAAVDETCAPTVRVYPPGSVGGLVGTKALKEFIASVRRVFPDLSLKIEDELAEGSLVATRWSTGGTQRGEWNRGVPPTGKVVTWTGMSIYRLIGGKIVEERLEENLLSVEEQVGVVLRRRSSTP